MAESFTELCRNWKARGVCARFSGVETNNIGSHVYTLFPNKSMPILSKEINPKKEGKVTGGGGGE